MYDQIRMDEHDDNRHSNATNFTNFIEHAQGFPSSNTMAASPESKTKRRPTPLDLSNAFKYAQIANYRRGVKAIHNPITPQEGPATAGSSSSVYSDETPLTVDRSVVSPLHIVKQSTTSINANVLKSYKDWKDTSSPEDMVHGRPKSIADCKDGVRLPGFVHAPPPSPPTSRENRGLVKSATTSDLRTEPRTAQTDVFTPLTPWLLDAGGKAKGKQSKTLFGNHGWLHDTAVSGAEKPAGTQKSLGFLDGIKKKAREIVGLQFTTHL
ncbi:hypothetical protein BX600DRAFT_450017 [Xylariales sp. PMI_506]|nr:hypothetical protein BX600DRAFT_450017 [Xylariales sp. PMI_506]